MRLLFNHGLTSGELFTNTPKKVSDRKWRWLIKHYGWTDTHNHAIARPFTYCLGLILTRVIEEQKRFIIPYVSDTYIDFEVVSDKKLMTQRQSGRFQEIDLISSDFTGYALTYYYKNKVYKKSHQIYLGGELKRSFLEKINSGVKFYTIKDLTLEDFIDDVHAEYNQQDRKEIKRILLHGFRRMHSAIKGGCAISIASKKKINYYAHIGSITLNVKNQLKEYATRRDRKLRKIESWNKSKFDGYYYIGLNPTGLGRWVKNNHGARTLAKFQNVIPRNLEKELYYRYKDVYMFRINIKKFRGSTFWADDLKCRDIKYIGEVHDLKFTKADKTWKELIKCYEEGKC